MLLGLVIRDIVLIDRLDLAFAPGLTVLTGETGAGKSILLDPATHGEMLDAHGGHDRPAVAEAWRAWRETAVARQAAESEIAAAKRDEEFLRHAAQELSGLAPQPGEEAGLAEQRSLMHHRSKLVEAIETAVDELSGERGGESQMNQARRRLDRIADKAAGRLDPAISALDRAQAELAEATDQLTRLARDLDADPRRLEKIEDRLYALRDLARKPNVPVDELAATRERIESQLARLDDRSGSLAKLTQAEGETRQAYMAAAEALSAARKKTAAKLDKRVMAELTPLKLDRARFATVIERLGEPH